MNDSGNPVKLVTQYPPPMLLPRSGNVATITPITPRMIESQVPEFDSRELMHLRCENLRLMEELDRARMHPMYDDALDRINISHEMWLRQQKDLRRLQDYKTRYYVVAFILIMIIIRFSLHFTTGF